jgi:hypothetical protein
VFLRMKIVYSITVTLFLFHFYIIIVVMLRGKAMIFMLKNNARVGITLSGGPRTPCQ